MPPTEDTIGRVDKDKYFSTMDIKRGYPNIEIRECNQHKNLFITPDGLYDFVRIPFGVTGSPATWQAVVDKAFRTVKWKDIVIVYIDYICTYIFYHR